MHGQPRPEGLKRRTLLRGGAAAATSIATGVATAALGSGLAACVPEHSRFVVLGTAETEGVYFQVGNAIAMLVNRDHRTHGVRCLPQSMPGSSANLTALVHDSIPLGLVQGNDLWSLPPAERSQLRVLAALHVESLVVLVGTEIATLDDLPGRRVALGPAGSGHRTAMTALLAARGWTQGHFADVHGDTTRSSLAAQCAGRIDAVPLMIGHPVATIADAMARCAVHPLTLADADLDALTSAARGFERVVVPAGTYGPGAPELATVGTRVLLACRADLPDRMAGLFVEAMLSDLEALRTAHPVLAGLTADALRPAPDLPVVIHDGAESAFRVGGVV